MNASSRKAARLLRDRRRANAKRTIATRVRKLTTDIKTVNGVTNALRTVAKKLRTAGQLGKVQVRIAWVAERECTGPVYRYTAAQIARIAASYKPRKPEYKAIALLLAA
jgi:hypothetical protein